MPPPVVPPGGYGEAPDILGALGGFGQGVMRELGEIKDGFSLEGLSKSEGPDASFGSMLDNILPPSYRGLGKAAGEDAGAMVGNSPLGLFRRAPAAARPVQRPAAGALERAAQNIDPAIANDPLSGTIFSPYSGPRNAAVRSILDEASDLSDPVIRSANPGRVAVLRDDVTARVDRIMEVARMGPTASDTDILDALLNAKTAGAIKLIEGGLPAAQQAKIARTIATLQPGISKQNISAARSTIRRVVGGDKDDALEFFGRLIMAGDDQKKISWILGDFARTTNATRLMGLAAARLVMGPGTHLVNVASNTFQTGMWVAKSTAAEPQFADARAVGFGIGIGNAIKAMPDIVRGADLVEKWGIPVRNMFAFRESDNLVKKGVKAVAQTEMRVGMAPLAVEDALIRSPIFHGELAVEYARRSGQSWGGRAWRQGLSAFLANPPDDAVEAAAAIAHRYTLSNRNPIASRLNQLGGLRDSADPAAKAVGIAASPFLFFTNVTVNLAQQSVANFAGVGWIRALGAGKTLAQRRALITQGTIGVGFLGSALGMLDNGDFTPARPKSDAEAARWQAEGRSPMSIRASEYPLYGKLFTKVLGEDNARKTWLTPYLLGPLLFNFSAAAAIHQTWKESEGSDRTLEERALAAGMAVGGQLIDQFPLLPQVDAIAPLFESESKERAFLALANLARPFVIPFDRLQAFVADLGAGFKRDPRTVYEIFQTGIPGLANQVPPKTDVLGRPEPIGEDESLGARAKAVALRSRQEMPHPVLDEIEVIRQHVPSFSGLSKAGSSVEYKNGDVIHLNQIEARDLNSTVGPVRDAVLSALLQSPKYRNANWDDKAKMFNNAKDRADDAGRLEFSKKLMAEAQDPSGRLRALKVGMSGQNSNYDKAQALMQLQPDPDTVRAFDALRKETNPEVEGYELSVDEYKKGHALVQGWLTAQPFITGNKAEWDAAATQAETYRPLYEQLKREAEARNIPIERHPNYRSTMRYFTEHKELRKYYNDDGLPDTRMLSRERDKIRANPLWRKFENAVK